MESTYNTNAYSNLQYALKVLINLNSTQKKRLFFFLLNLLIIKFKCLINISKICDLLRNG